MQNSKCQPNHLLIQPDLSASATRLLEALVDAGVDVDGRGVGGIGEGQLLGELRPVTLKVLTHRLHRHSTEDKLSIIQLPSSVVKLFDSSIVKTCD